MVDTPLSDLLVPYKPATVITLRNFFEAKHLLIDIVNDQLSKPLKNTKVIDVIRSDKLFIQKRIGKRNKMYGLISGMFNKHYIEVQNLYLDLISFKIDRYLQVIYQDGVREVLDIRNQEFDNWWLWCTWTHAPKKARNLCLVHAVYRLQNYPRFARDCCSFVNKTTCFCFYLTAEFNEQLLADASPPAVAEKGDGTCNNPYIL
jgi:hypothetical protein